MIVDRRLVAKNTVQTDIFGGEVFAGKFLGKKPVQGMVSIGRG